MKFYSLPIILLLIITTLTASPVPDDEVERRHRKRKRRPCNGRESGRTFFDWSFLYVDVTNTHNYNVNCGGTPIVPAPAHFPQTTVYGHRPHHGDCKKLHGCHGGLGNRLGLGFLDLFLPINKNPNVEETADYDDSSVAKPVSEEYDDVPPPDMWKPGKYVGVYNPLLGSYVTSVKSLSKNVEELFEPLYDYFQ